MINTLKTVILLGSLTGLLLLIGGLIGGQSGLTTALIIAFFMNFIAYFFSDKLVLRLYRAQPLDEQRYSAIYKMVQQLASTMKLPMPKLWLVQTPMANAFATGRNPANASVALTSGILDILDQDELRGVLAHELSHIKNRDMLVSTIAATLAGAIGYLANMAQYHALYQSMNGNQKRHNTLGLFIASLLVPFIAMLLQLAVSRSREFLADESGAECTHEPLALAAALKKLQQAVGSAHLDPRDKQKAATAPLFIVHPFRADSLTALFSTHPPMNQRIERLEKMAQRSFMR